MEIEYLNIEYLENKAKRIEQILTEKGYKSASNSINYLNNFLKETINKNKSDDKEITIQVNKKYIHILQVVEEYIDYVEGNGKYQSQKGRFEDKEKEINILIGIFHDVGRAFEIKALGNCGYNMKYNHSHMGAIFLEENNNIDKFLGKDSNYSEEEKQIMIYCVEHHGDKDIPNDCPDKTRPYLESIRKIDRIANLIQGETIPVELMTASFTPEEIASISDPNHNGVIDEITLAELTTGILSEDKTKVYKGIDRNRKDIKYTPMRMYLSRVGWIYADDNDIDFYRYCKNNNIIPNYCNKIHDYLAEDEKTKLNSIIDYAERFIDNKIKQLSRTR